MGPTLGSRLVTQMYSRTIPFYIGPDLQLGSRALAGTNDRHLRPWRDYRKLGARVAVGHRGTGRASDAMDPSLIDGGPLLMTKFGQTPSQTVGPYFSMVLGGQNVMVRPDGRGERIRIEGRVVEAMAHHRGCTYRNWQANRPGVPP